MGINRKDFEEVTKRVRAEKIKDSFMLIRLRYDYQLVLPYSDGMAFMSSLSRAEQLNEHYQKQKNIAPFHDDSVQIRPMSRQEYERIKIAALLGCSCAELESFENSPAETT